MIRRWPRSAQARARPFNCDQGSVNYARILLKVAGGWTDQQIRASLDVSVPTVERVRQRFVEEGLQQALVPRKTRRKYLHLMDVNQETHLLALVCSQPPKGYRRWSLRLLVSEMVRLDYIAEVSHVTVRIVMQNNELKPWLKEEWYIPPKQNAEFVYHMEMCWKFTDVLKMHASR